jgi:hypothetical protein
MEIEVDGMQEIVLDMVTVLEVVVTVLVVTVPVMTVPVVTVPVVTVVIGPIAASPPQIAVAVATARLLIKDPRSSIIHPEGAALTSIAH